MRKLPLLLLIIPLLLPAKRVKPKVMHAQNQRDYHDSYAHSSNQQDRGEEIFCSTTEASGEIVFMIALQTTSEITSEEQYTNSRLSYLDHNRIEITEDIAKGEGEHLETLLSMIKPNYNKKKSLTILQKNFSELSYLNHHDFLKRIETLI
jgi:hypothetical protein